MVTGATGLLGSHLIFQLVSRGQAVRALYRSEDRKMLVREIFNFYSPENGQDYFDQIEWVKGDILDIIFLEELITEGCDLYHCAALVSFHHRDFSSMIKLNREGTENVVNVALYRNVRKFCHASSVAAIGNDASDEITEKTKWKNTPETSGYAISKYGAERAVWRGIEEGLNAVIVNPSVIFGAGNWNDSSLTIFRTVAKGLRYYPPGANATVDARDVAEIMIRLMDTSISSERFLCVGSNQSFQELMTVISKEVGVSPPRIAAKRWQVKTVRLILALWNGIIGKRSSITKDNVSNLFTSKQYSNEKIKKALGIEFRGLEEQVRNAVAGQMSQS